MGVQHLRVGSATHLTQVNGFTRWEKQVFLLGITETVQMYRGEVAVAKGTLLLLKVLGKEMLPRWCGQMKQALLSSAQPQCSSQDVRFSAQLTSPAQIPCQCNFTASALVLAHSSALRQQSTVPQRPAQRGSFSTPTAPLQRDAAALMSQVGWE